MKTAAQLMNAFFPLFRTPERAAALFAEDGEIHLLREALNVIATARAFSPNGLADLEPVSASV
jgi:hypothetical protein